jgi:uncharacterized membrane protein
MPMMGFGFLSMLLFWGILLLLVVGGVGLVVPQTGTLQVPARRNQRTARQVLDRRLALGEIGPEEYDRLRAQIE